MITSNVTPGIGPKGSGSGSDAGLVSSSTTVVVAVVERFASVVWPAGGARFLTDIVFSILIFWGKKENSNFVEKSIFYIHFLAADDDEKYELMDRCFGAERCHSTTVSFAAPAYSPSNVARFTARR